MERNTLEDALAAAVSDAGPHRRPARRCCGRRGCGCRCRRTARRRSGAPPSPCRSSPTWAATSSPPTRRPNCSSGSPAPDADARGLTGVAAPGPPAAGPACRGPGRRPGPAAAAVRRDRAERRRERERAGLPAGRRRTWPPSDAGERPGPDQRRDRCRSGPTACWPASRAGLIAIAAGPRRLGRLAVGRVRRRGPADLGDARRPGRRRRPGPRRRRRRAGGLGGRAAGRRLPDRRHLPRRTASATSSTSGSRPSRPRSTGATTPGPGQLLLQARRPVQRADHAGHRRAHDRRADPDAPQHPVADLDLQVGGGLGVPAGGQCVLGVVEHADAQAAKAEVDLGDGRAERRDRAVADAERARTRCRRPGPSQSPAPCRPRWPRRS